MIEKLIFYMGYPFVRYALIVGVLIALCSSLLGVTLVLKRFSFIGDGLSHVAFGSSHILAKPVFLIVNVMTFSEIWFCVSCVCFFFSGLTHDILTCVTVNRYPI